MALYQETVGVINGSPQAHHAPQVGSDLMWAVFHLEAAAVGERLSSMLEAGSLGELVQLFEVQWDGLETAAMSLGFSDPVVAIDLCADALYMVIGGMRYATGKFRDMGWWTPKRVAALPPRLRDWIEGVLGSSDWARLTACRHPIIHRYLERTIPVAFTDSLAGGQTSYRRSLARIALPPPPPYTAPATPLGSVGDLIPQLRLFADEQYRAFCTALQEAYG